MEKSLLKQLKKEERHLKRQIREATKALDLLEKQGCYSDKELVEKDRLLRQQELQIQSLQRELFQVQRALRLND
ncbi:MAG: hypothetical protein D6736_10900 [Nitrospinota bacterium]|nr:MAG: hypothetical protein D6736_10900 [Nitrospinota bacterium]